MKIAYRSPFVPLEWLEAHEAEPVRYIPDGRHVPPGPLRSDEGVCPFLRAWINEVASMTSVEGVVLTTFCDQVRRASELLPHQTFLMHLPTTWQSPVAQKAYADELRRLGRWLQRMGGTPPSPDELRQIMDIHDRHRARQTFAACSPLRRASESPPTPLHDAALASRAIALVGGPLLGMHEPLVDGLRQAGARIVLDATERGTRTQPPPFDRRRMREDPFGTLCDGYFGSIPDAFRRPNTELYAWLRTALLESGVDGVIMVRYLWCDTWHAEVSRLRQWLDVPLLDLDLADAPLSASQLTRVEAFLEALS